MKIILLEDSPLDAELATHALARGGLDCEVLHVVDRAGFEVALEQSADVIISDYSIPGFDGLDALRLSRERRPGVPFIFLSGVVGEEFAVEAIKAGATDYVTKQRLVRLPVAVERALKEVQVERARARAEAQLRLLVQELRHRVKNTLASVSALNWLTARNSRTLEEFQSAFSGRIQALSQAHELLFETSWRSADLKVVLQRALAPYLLGKADTFLIEGPEVKVAPKQAVALTLVVHELATNAAKYGALSRPRGRVALTWTINEESALRLSWVESGGPPVKGPGRRGFGSTLIERTVSDDLEGVVTLDYRPEGLVCILIMVSAPTAWDTANLDDIDDLSTVEMG